MVREDRPPLPDGLGRDRALDRAQPPSHETLRHLSIGLLPDEFIAGLAAPEIHAGDFKEFPCCLAELSNQLVGVGFFAGVRSNTQQKVLEALVKAGEGAVSWRNHRTANRSADICTDAGEIVFAIHKCLNLMGN